MQLLLLLLCSAAVPSLQCNQRQSQAAEGDQQIRSARLIQLEGDSSAPLETLARQETLAPLQTLAHLETLAPLEEVANDSRVSGEEVEEFETSQRTGKQVPVSSRISACYRLVHLGYRFYPSVVREGEYTGGVQACADACKNTTYCRSVAFSANENLEENCKLSELTVDKIDLESDATEDLENAGWDIYAVAEQQNCQDFTQKPPIQPVVSEDDDDDDDGEKDKEPENCQCVEFTDSEGGGNCRQQGGWSGRFWCYVSPDSDCRDLAPDPALPFLSRSSEACSTGPCECNEWGFTSQDSQGVCMQDIFHPSSFCYVALESRCPDKIASKHYSSLYWSSKACSPDDSDGEGSGEDEEEGSGVDEGEGSGVEGEGSGVEENKIISTHFYWNFTISDPTICYNFCAYSERCRSQVFANYNPRDQTCHLTRPPPPRPVFQPPIHYDHHHHYY